MPPLTSAMKLMLAAGGALALLGLILFASAHVIAFPNGSYDYNDARVCEIRLNALGLIFIFSGLLTSILATYAWCRQPQKQ